MRIPVLSSLCISTAPGTSQERTAEVVKQVDKMLANNPAIATRNAIMGYSFIGGAGSNQGTIIVKLKPFEERPGGVPPYQGGLYGWRY